MFVLLPLPFILAEPSTPTELRLGIDGVDDGVPASTVFPIAFGEMPVLELRRDPPPPGTDVTTSCAALGMEGPCFTGDSVICKGFEDLGRVLEPLLCTLGERPIMQMMM